MFRYEITKKEFGSSSCMPGKQDNSLDIYIHYKNNHLLPRLPYSIF